MTGKNRSSLLATAHEDMEIIDDVNYLNKQGFRIWYDKGIREGTEWKESIRII